MSPARYANPAASTSQAQDSLSPIAAVFLLLSIVVAFGVCSNLLRVVGIDYVMPGGQPLQKIHPATYLIVLTCGLAVITQKTGLNPLTLFDSVTIRVYIFATFIFIGYSTVVLQGPVSLGIDTWLSSGLFAALLLHTNGHQRRMLGAAIHLLLLLNSAMGVYETITDNTIIPSYVFDYSANASSVMVDASKWGDVRSAGLFGHPLTSTMAAGGLAIAMFAQIAFVKSTPLRWFALGHALVAMPCFGGRFSIGVAIFLISIMLLTRLVMFMRGRSASLFVIIICVLLAASLPFLAIVAFEMGFFNAVTSRIENDDGSAATRLAALDLLMSTPWDELLLGNLNGWLKIRQIQAGTPLGIEISWVAFVLEFGFLMFVLMMGCMWALLKKMTHDRDPSCWWLVAFFLIALSSGTGLASKDFSLLFVVCMTSVLFPARIVAAPLEIRSQRKTFVLKPAGERQGSLASSYYPRRLRP